MITADLGDESAVREAFANAAADPDLPPAGVIAFVGHPAFDGTDADGALAHARDVIWAVAATVRAIAGSWHGKPPRLWLVSRGGLVVDGLDADESGNPGIGSLKGLVAGAGLRAPGSADHAARSRTRPATRWRR